MVIITLNLTNQILGPITLCKTNIRNNEFFNILIIFRAQRKIPSD